LQIIVIFDGDRIIHGKLQQQKIEELNNERSEGDQVFCACARARAHARVCVDLTSHLNVLTTATIQTQAHHGDVWMRHEFYS
jgi:hypothetical protein